MFPWVFRNISVNVQECFRKCSGILPWVFSSVSVNSISLDSGFRTCFCLSEVREYWLLIYSSNLSKSAYNFIHARSTTIADCFSINCLLQTIVFWAKSGILSIVSGSKNSKLDIFLDYFLLTHHMERYLTGLFIWHIDINRIRFSSIPLIQFILLLFIEIDFILSRKQFDVTKH